MVQREAPGIRLARPDVGAAELAAIGEVLETGHLTMGPKVREFEALLAGACETRHAVAVSSGTAALHLAVLALEHPNAVGESFNIGNARSAVTIFDLATRIKRLTGCTGEIVFRPLHYTDVELRIPNVDKARTLLGFEAKVELDEGLEKTIAWYRAKSPTSV